MGKKYLLSMPFIKPSLLLSTLSGEFAALYSHLGRPIDRVEWLLPATRPAETGSRSVIRK
jgi:hypothetical protein